MSMNQFVSPDVIRAKFSSAMSHMYRAEVPLYGELLELVAKVNKETLEKNPQLLEHLTKTNELERLDDERHGAIRLGTPEELHTMRRLFAVMGMSPVGYYDLTPAGVPVHSTAFRAIHEDSLAISPFRVFTSLLRLELIEDEALQNEAREILAKRNIFTDKAIELIEQHEKYGGLTEAEAELFIQEVLETFRWHAEATVTSEQYQKLHDQHRLIADVVAFKGPHINHLTPRTLDIDWIQELMPQNGINAKAIVEGPPPRKHPILLRQTSFKALQENVRFLDQKNGEAIGSHTARFGEIEQRGAALTPKGRLLYDELLNKAREQAGDTSEKNADNYRACLAETFKAFPDSLEELHDEKLAYFLYYPTASGLAKTGSFNANVTIDELIKMGVISYEPIVYEDFLPVSAAGIFQSNLGDDAQAEYSSTSNHDQFIQILGTPTIDELTLYKEAQDRSWEQCKKSLSIG